MKPDLLHSVVLEVKFDQGSEAMPASKVSLDRDCYTLCILMKGKEGSYRGSATEKSEEDCFCKKSFECPGNRL